VEKLGGEKVGLQREKSDLQRQVTDLAACVDKLNRDKVALEQQMEMEVGGGGGGGGGRGRGWGWAVVVQGGGGCAAADTRRARRRALANAAPPCPACSPTSPHHTSPHTSPHLQEENIVNRLQRQLEASTHNYRLLEQRLEAKVRAGGRSLGGAERLLSGC
jgi:hypothetical protein